MAISERRMTAEEYFKLPETNTPMQLIDGVIIMSPSPTLDHQDAVLNTATYLRQLRPDGKVYVAPIDVHLNDMNVVQPDVAWLHPQTKCTRFERKHLLGAPDLVVEVLSPGTARFDRNRKLRLYEQYGTQEYWVEDVITQLVEVWTLADGAFKYIGAYGTGDTFASPLLGQTVDVTAIFPPAESA